MQISQRTQFFPIPTSDVRLILILSGSFLTGAGVMLQIIFRVPLKYTSASAFGTSFQIFCLDTHLTLNVDTNYIR